MTLKEAFELLRPEHRPKVITEAEVCWAMTRALRDAKHCPRFWIDMVETDCGHGFSGDDVLETLAAAYAAAFAKENK